jgi:predicted metalloprotease
MQASAVTFGLFLACCFPHQAWADISDQDLSPRTSKDIVAGVLGDTEDVWSALLLGMGRGPYPKPLLVLFSGTTKSDCGLVRRSVEPVYCPADRKIYVDLAPLSEWSRRQGSASSFVQAFLVAHEVSHHVQNALGVPPKDDAAMTVPELAKWKLRYELQADCYTGVWVYFVQKRGLLDPGDLEEGLPAALALDPAATPSVVTQRMRWFRQGLASGDPRRCDTFGIPRDALSSSTVR